MTNIINRIPAPIEDIRNVALPELLGSEKQVKWAIQIRNEILMDLLNKLNAQQWVPILSSREEMIKWVEAYPLKGTEVTPEEYGLKLLLEQYDKFQRLLKLSQETNAGWWIDHRTNSAKNYMNQTLRKKILG